ncbi:Vps62-related protein [Candidatus Riflebacteria bacterium]
MNTQTPNSLLLIFYLSFFFILPGNLLCLSFPTFEFPEEKLLQKLGLKNEQKPEIISEEISPFQLKLIGEKVLIFRILGHNSQKLLSFWRPTFFPGHIFLGDFFWPGSEAPPWFPIFIFKDHSRIFIKPASFKLIGRFKSASGLIAGSLWFPEAPQDFVAMGIVATRGKGEPANRHIRCVSKDYVNAGIFSTGAVEVLLTRFMHKCGIFKVEKGEGSDSLGINSFFVSKGAERPEFTPFNLKLISSLNFEKIARARTLFQARCRVWQLRKKAIEDAEKIYRDTITLELEKAKKASREQEAMIFREKRKTPKKEAESVKTALQKKAAEGNLALKKELKEMDKAKPGSIRGLFLDYLGREPQKTEFLNWKDRFERMQVSFENLRDSILQSSEFEGRERIRKKIIIKLYEENLFRSPKKEELTKNLSRMANGSTIEKLTEDLYKTWEYKTVLKKGGNYRITRESEKRVKTRAEYLYKYISRKIEKDGNLVLSTFNDFNQSSLAKKIEIRDTTIFKAKTSRGFFLFITGRTDLFGLTDVRVLSTVSAALSGYPGHCFSAFFTEPWTPARRYTAGYPLHLKNMLNSIELKDGIIFISSAGQVLDSNTMPGSLVDYISPLFKLLADNKKDEFNLKLWQGVYLLGRTRFSEIRPLQNLKRILVAPTEKIILSGYLPDDCSEISLNTEIDCPVSQSILPQNFKPANGNLEITGKPEVVYNFPLKIALSREEKTLQLRAKLSYSIAELNNDELEFSAYMKDTWKEPFAIRGLKFTDLSLNTRISNVDRSIVYRVLTTMQFGPKELLLIARLPVIRSFDGILFSDTVARLSFKDMILQAASLGCFVKSHRFPVANLAIKDATVSIAAYNKNLPGQQNSIMVSGNLMLANKQLAPLQIKINRDEGIFASGRAKKIKLGALELGGQVRDAGKIIENPEATIAITLSPVKQHFYIRGKGEVLGINRELNLLLEKAGVEFSFQDKIFHLYQADVSVKGTVTQSEPGYSVAVKLQSDFKLSLQDLIEKEIEGSVPEFVRDAYANLFIIESAEFSGRLKTFVRGRIPEMNIGIRYLAKRKVLTYSYDFGQNSKSIEMLVKSLAGEILKEMQDFGRKVEETAEIAAEDVFKNNEKEVTKILQAVEAASEKVGQKASIAAEEASENMAKMEKHLNLILIEAAEKLKEQELVAENSVQTHVLDTSKKEKQTTKATPARDIKETEKAIANAQQSLENLFKIFVD